MRPPLVANLFRTLRDHNAVDSHVEHMTNPMLMKQILDLIDGKAVICNAMPCIDSDENIVDMTDGGNCSVHDHDWQPLLEWDKGAMVDSIFRPFPKIGGVKCEQAIRELEEMGRKALNVCPLRVLLKCTWLIPDEWKGLRVHFPMTVFGQAPMEQHHFVLLFNGGWRKTPYHHQRAAPLEKGDVIAIRPRT